MKTILIIDDNETIREALSHTGKKLGHRALVASSGAQGLELARGKGPVDFVITDLKMDGMDGVQVLREVQKIDPDVPILIITAYGTVETAVEAIHLGAFDFLTKPFTHEVVTLKIERALELCGERRGRRRLEAMSEYHRDESERRYTFAELIGRSEPMQRVFRAVEKVARSDSSVFISGESGTGKELVARAIHDHSPRGDGPFIKVSCGALAETLLESELFGHEKGAFTGAVKTKLGRFELADGGTLFLDEIGDVSLAVQVKLLRAIQEREIERVGGERPIRVDVRIVSATHRDLEREVEAGRFRQDLYYRLHVVPLRLPPLRERRDDIPLLARHFVRKLSSRTNASVRSITDDALARLWAHTYPGNVRELENVIEQALVFAEGDAITTASLPAALTAGTGDAGLEVPREKPLPEILEDLERQLIERAYHDAGGVKTETARMLGIKTSALYYKLDKYGLG